jgi:DNA-binding transcriptional LysR family regulator
MNVPAFDLNLLKAFEALMDERAVTRAGQRIGLSQPAMSHALLRLRHVFRDELFVRTPGGMEPTPRAIELAPEIGAALEHVRKALNQVSPFDPATTERTFTAGVAEYIEIALIEKLTEAFEGRAPRADLRFVPATKATFVRQLDEGVIDVAVGHLKDVAPHLEVRPLFADRLVLVARADHPTLQRRLDLETYLRLTHALVSPTGEKSGAVDRELATKGLSRRVGLVVATYLALPLALRRSDLVAAVPSRTATRLASMAGLKMHDLPFEHATEADLVWHRRDDGDRGHRWFRELLAELAAD